MTIQTTSSKVTYQGNGASTVFSFPFKCPSGQYLRVTYIDANGTETVLSTSLYSVAFATDFIGGSVTYPLTGSPIASDTSLLIQRIVPFKQLTSLGGQSGFFPSVVEGMGDNLEMQLQQLQQSTLQALTFPLADNNPQTVLPLAALRAGKYLTFDALGNPQVTPSAGGTSSDLSSYTALSTGSSTARTMAVRFADMVNVKDFGALGNLVQDDATYINNAITYVSTHGSGGGGVFFPQGAYLHNTAITLKNNIVLWGLAGSGLVWGGGATPQITSATTGYLNQAGIIGLDLASVGASKSIELFSPWRCTFRDMTINTGSATSFVIDVLCNSSGTTNADGNYNAVFNYFESILQTGTCGTMIRLRGNAVGPPGQVVTLNTFHSINALGCSVRGVDFSRWCDNNTFTGMTRLAMIASNGVGVEWNSASPAANVGVYANNFEHLAVDTFVIGGVVGRVGFKMNNTKESKIGYYFNDPVAEGGSYIIDALCLSYDFVLAVDADNEGEGKTNAIYHRTNASRMSEGTWPMDMGTMGAADFRLWAGGTVQMRMRHEVTAVNYWDAFGAIAGGSLILRADGASANVGAVLASKGTGSVTIATNQNAAGANIGLIVTHIAAGVNYVEVQQNTAGQAPVLRAGGEANASLAVQSKGTGSVLLGTNSSVNQMLVTHTAGATRQVTATGSAAGNPAISANGGELAVGTHGWLLGAANVVAPTAPNRTITVTIDGTTYYLHAKTTND